MKVTLNWLKQYVDFNWSPEELAERLTLLGLEVEGVRRLAGEFDGVVVAQILTRDKVPGSDKLSVCKVNDGRAERTIICGAQNHKVGDKVPLILPNYALPLKAGEQEPFVIKERKVFGIVSQGMMQVQVAPGGVNSQPTTSGSSSQPSASTDRGSFSAR